nr:hypothetical protein [Tanacetum cinerariifolium]
MLRSCSKEIHEAWNFCSKDNKKHQICVMKLLDIYGDPVVSCAGIIGIKHRHNVVHDTLVDICFWLGILAGKEVDIMLGGGWSSPLMQTGMVDFVPGRAVIDATHSKRVKYEAKCANIGYDFLPFSFSSLQELENDTMTLLKRIQKFSVT